VNIVSHISTKVRIPAMSILIMVFIIQALLFAIGFF
jgi:hypothetical protein